MRIVTKGKRRRRRVQDCESNTAQSNDAKTFDVRLCVILNSACSLLFINIGDREGMILLLILLIDRDC